MIHDHQPRTDQAVGSHFPVLRVLCGLPYSGKSLYAREAGCPIVEPDAIRVAMHGQRFEPKAEPFVWAVTETMIRALFLSGHPRVILDATNITQARRKQWESESWRTEFVHIIASSSLCLLRAQRAGDTEIIPVIERMAAQWEPFEDLSRVTQIHSTEPHR